MSSTVRCNKCDAPIDAVAPEQLWDGKPYCTACIEAAGLSEFSPDELEEHVEFTLGEAAKRGLWSYLYGTGLLVAASTSLLMVLMPIDLARRVLGGEAADPHYVWALPLSGLMMAAFMWLFFSVLSFPLLFLAPILSRERTISVRDGEFTFKTTSRKETAPLSACRWEIKEIAGEDFGYFRLGRSLMVVTLILPSGSGARSRVVCGFDDRKLRMWKGFFELVGVQENAANWRRCIRPLALGAAWGGAAGVVLGMVVWMLFGKQQWLGVGFATGVLDGLLTVGISLWITSLTSTEYKKQSGKWTPLMVTCGYAAVSSLADGAMAREYIVYYMSIHAIVGGFVGLLLHRRRLEQDEDETDEKRDDIYAVN